MLKKMLSLLLTAALLGALGAPARAAEDSADVRLARVTQAVKQTLNLNTNDYDDFQGECYDEELVPVWNLRWSSGDRYVRVEALEDGTIVSFHLSSDDLTPWGRNFPAFPKRDALADRTAAEAFLKKVLRSYESIDLDSFETEDSLNNSDSSFHGTVQINGLLTKLNYNLTVQNGEVTRFWRTIPENSFIGGIPSPETDLTPVQAAEKFRDILKLRLEYVQIKDDSGQAVLRYVPEDMHTYYVDAVSGELVDLTELEELMSRKYANSMGGAAADMAAPTASPEAAREDGGLSAAEQSGIQQMEGVLPKETLDQNVRTVEAFGLKGYTLAGASYSVGEKDDDGTAEVLCALRYQKPGEKYDRTRTVTVDARTGEVKAVRSFAPWGEEEPVLTLEQAQKFAEDFLRDFRPEQVGALELYDQTDLDDLDKDNLPPYYLFLFAQKVNGFFFPENQYQICIDASDGSVYRLDCQWDASISFDSAEGVVSEQAALDAWLGSYDVTLGYSLVPQELTSGDAVAERLTGMGMSHYYGLKLGYTLERDGWFAGVDAKSGELVDQNAPGKQTLSYVDLSDSSAKEAVEQLARFGVGYDCEYFQPGKSLTQWDLVCLLYSLEGGRLNPDSAEKQDKDSAYSYAYRLGALTRDERNDGAPLTRGQLVKILVNAAGFGDAARLNGIFTCDFSDKDRIPADEMGYAAIAQALGLVDGAYAGTQGTSRGEAAIMLCKLLGRE